MQRPIETVIVPQDVDERTQTTFEIMREPGNDWRNRFVRNAETKEIAYYCEVEPVPELKDTKLIIHRGDISGPVIGLATPCPEIKYQTDLHLHGLTIPLKHKHFVSDGKKYCWKTPKQLIQEDTQEMVAEFKPSVFEGERHVLHEVGTLEIERQDITDLVVLTALVVQERDEEMMSLNERARRRAREMGLNGN